MRVRSAEEEEGRGENILLRESGGTKQRNGPLTRVDLRGSGYERK